VGGCGGIGLDATDGFGDQVRPGHGGEVAGGVEIGQYPRGVGEAVERCHHGHELDGDHAGHVGVVAVEQDLDVVAQDATGPGAVACSKVSRAWAVWSTR
jgi:hypothetical protein